MAVICVVGSPSAFRQWVGGVRDTFPGIPMRVTLQPGRLSFVGLEETIYRHVTRRNDVRGLTVGGALYLHDAYTLPEINEIGEEIRLRAVNLHPSHPIMREYLKQK